MKSNKNPYGYLKKSPRIRGVNSIYNIGFIEKHIGKKDAQENQVCQLERGHVTPYIDNKAHLYNSYIDKTYLRTSLTLEPVVEEANALVVELKLMSPRKHMDRKESGEEAQRQATMEAAERVKRERRKAEILTRIAEIKAESDMVDESLMHHIERAEGVLHAHISKYWCGILSAATAGLEHFPYLEEKDYAGREAYLLNRKNLVSMIADALEKGGDAYGMAEE